MLTGSKGLIGREVVDGRKESPGEKSRSVTTSQEAVLWVASLLLTSQVHKAWTISDCKFDELDYSLSEGGIGWRVGKRWGWLPRREECARLRCR